MKRRVGLGMRWMQRLVFATVLVPAAALAAPPPTVESGTGASHARTIGRITIGGVASNLNARGFRWGVSSAGGAARPVFAELYVVKAVDTSSPVLMLRAALGSNIPTVTVELFAPGTTNVLATYELTDVRVLAVTDADPGRSSSSGGQPLEEIGFSYRRLRTTVGNTVSCFDQATGSSC